MRILFMGTPDFAVPTLDALIAAGHNVVRVYSQPPRPAGRGKAPRPTPVANRAAALGLDVATPLSLRDRTVQAEFAAFDADYAVVAAYGLILPRAILAAPKRGCVNVHASLLPRWRGAAPVQRAILAGDDQTGITLMDMEAGLDTGPMRLKRTIPIGAQSAGQLTEALARLGAAALIEMLADPGAFPPVPQPEAGITYAPKIEKAESRLDFRQPAPMVLRRIQAFAPAPGAFVALRGEERLRVLAAHIAQGEGPPGTVLDERFTIACGQGAIRPTLVQRAGRGAMTPAELLRGFPLGPGTCL